MASSRVCNINICKRSVSGLCTCCRQNLCTVHLNEHADFLLTAETTPLADQIKKLCDQVMSIPPLEPLFLTELDQWREQAHQEIDRFSERKKQQFEEFLRKQRKKSQTKLDQLMEKIDELAREEKTTRKDVNLIQTAIQSAEHEINQLQFLRPIFAPLVIDDKLIVIHQNMPTFDNILPLASPLRTINGIVSANSITASENHLLVFLNNHLCLLDRQINVQREITWNNGLVFDMFWSSTLARFILVTSKEIFILDETTMTFTQCSTLVDTSRTGWFCGTCWNDTLILSTAGYGPMIFAYTLQPSIEFINKHQSPFTWKKDERIHDLSLYNDSLAMVIKNRETAVRLDLCSPITLERYYSIDLGWIPPRSYRPRCCSLMNNQWMFINPHNSELCHISKNGEIIKKDNYKLAPYHVAHFVESDLIAILTVEGVHLHQLS